MYNQVIYQHSNDMPLKTMIFVIYFDMSAGNSGTITVIIPVTYYSAREITAYCGLQVQQLQEQVQF